MNFLLLLIVLATVVTVLSAESFNQLYGSSVGFFCNDPNDTPDAWFLMKDLSSTMVTLSNGDSIEFEGDSILKIKNLSAADEGVYLCKKNSETLMSFNLTIVGIVTFAGCLPPVGDDAKNCDSGSVLTYSEGDTIVINILWSFFGEGSRNVEQSIENIRLKSNSDTLLVLCEMGKNCIGIDRIEFDYPKQNNIQVSINNASVSDSGIYTAEAIVKHNSVFVETITWSVRVNVTSVEDPTVTVTTMISSTIVQDTITPTIANSNDDNAVTSMTTISSNSNISPTIDISPTNSSSASQATTTGSSHSNASNSTSGKQQEMIVIVVGVIISSLILTTLIIIAATVIMCLIRRRCQFVSFISAKSKFASVADHFHPGNKISLPDKISVTNGSSYANSFLSVPTTDHQAIYEQRVLHSVAQENSSLSNEHNSEKVTV